MGIIFKGKAWGKIRPMIQIIENHIEFHAGISHSQKEGMLEITPQDLQKDAKLPLVPKPFAGLSHKSPLKMGLGELGETTPEFDQKLLQAHAKLKGKIEKRHKQTP